MVVKINYDLCNGVECAECVDACPMEVFEVDEDKVIVAKEDDCTYCGVCVDTCPNDAIILEE